MRRYFLQRAVSRASKRTVAFGKSKSGSKRAASKFQLWKKASTTARRKPGTRFNLWSRLNESRMCKYFGFVMTLLLFIGAVVMVILYFHKQKKIMTKSDAIAAIREFMILHNKSFQGKTDSEILEGAQHLAEYLLQLESRNEKIEKDTNTIIKKLIEGWKPFSGNLYYFSSTTQPADYAQYYCGKHGDNMVDVTSPEEEEYLEKEVTHRAESHFLGLWKTGTQWLWETNKTLTTSYWAENQPDNSGLCAMMVKCSTRGRCWKAVDCSHYHRFICKLRPISKYL